MSKMKCKLWGREFNLEILYDCCDDERVLDTQKEALKDFMSSNYANDSLEQIKAYCLEHNNGELNEVMITNIFKYVIPKQLYLERNPKKEVIAILCDYKFDLEHGLAIVFEDGILREIGSEDSIL